MDGQTGAAYDLWRTTSASDLEHLSDCNCADCHAWHVSEGMVQGNATLPDFECCKDQLDAWISEGKVCRKHPYSYFEPETGFCEECEFKGGLS